MIQRLETGRLQLREQLSPAYHRPAESPLIFACGPHRAWSMSWGRCSAANEGKMSAIGSSSMRPPC